MKGQQAYIQRINASPGLYFDYLGKIRIDNGRLNVLIPLDVSHLKQHVENIEHALNTGLNLCTETRIIESLECHSILQPLTTRYHDILREFRSISELLDNKFKRSAWIGGIGTGIKHIFGNLDEDDGIRYDEAIESIQNIQKELATLMKENIMVTTSIVSSFNKTLNKIKINEANLNIAIDSLTTSIRNMSNELETRFYMNQIFNFLETSILTLSFQLEDIVTSILFSSQNILHPAIITPYQLYQELADNIRHLNFNEELPIHLDINTMHVILNVSTITSYYNNKRIVFVVTIPLVTPVEYNLYHVLPLPTPHKDHDPNSYSMIIPRNKYIAMTRDNSYYCGLDSLNDCKILTPETFICYIPNTYSSSINPTCEIELMTKVISVIPVQCETKFIFGSVSLWKPLSNNKWIYVQSDPTKVSVDCPGHELYDIKVLGTGVLSVPSKCTAFTKNMKFITRHVSVNVSSPTYNLEFNILNDSCCNLPKLHSLIDSVSPASTILKNIDLDDLNIKNNEKILNSLLHSTDKIINEPHIVKYGTHYSILTVVIIIILYLVSKIYIYYKPGSNRNPLNLIRFSKNPPSVTIEDDTVIEIPSPSIRRNI